jgi:hypothetical protein
MRSRSSPPKVACCWCAAAPPRREHRAGRPLLCSGRRWADYRRATKGIAPAGARRANASATKRAPGSRCKVELGPPSRKPSVSGRAARESPSPPAAASDVSRGAPGRRIAFFTARSRAAAPGGGPRTPPAAQTAAGEGGGRAVGRVVRSAREGDRFALAGDLASLDKDDATVPRGAAAGSDTSRAGWCVRGLKGTRPHGVS